MDQGAAVLIIFFILLAVAGFAVWIWALVDVVRVPDESMFRAGNKLIWVLVVVLAGFVGAIVYLIVGRPAPNAQRPAGGGWVPPPPPGSLG
jgi:hypothetical protein